MSEDTLTNISTITTNIATDSTALRAALVEIAAKLQPLIKSAGIEFASDDPDQVWTYPYGYLRLCVRRTQSGWALAVEEILLSDGMGVSDGCNVFGGGADWVIPFTTASRTNLENVVERLPAFLLAYSDELERMGKHYADLRHRAEAMLASTTPPKEGEVTLSIENASLFYLGMHPTDKPNSYGAYWLEYVGHGWKISRDKKLCISPVLKRGYFTSTRTTFFTKEEAIKEFNIWLRTVEQ